jgi:malate dehydrogenase (oxaloacetate-decarboxylating)
MYAQPIEPLADLPRSLNGNIGIADVLGKVHATVLIGLSSSGGAFSEAVIREMAAHTDRPIIFPLSNPTSRSEAKPDDIVRWTEGRALVATGSPFAPVSYGGRSMPIAQCNNVYIFPAIGLGAMAARARRITDGMILAAARALAANSPVRTDPGASLLPPLTSLREVARDIAVAVGREAQRAGVAPWTTEEDLRERVALGQWSPNYPVLTPRSQRSPE